MKVMPFVTDGSSGISSRPARDFQWQHKTLHIKMKRGIQNLFLILKTLKTCPISCVNNISYY